MREVVERLKSIAIDFERNENFDDKQISNNKQISNKHIIYDDDNLLHGYSSQILRSDNIYSNSKFKYQLLIDYINV